jgi:hypothetical protein
MLLHQQTFTENITGWMKDQNLFHSLTRSSYATSPTDHSSRISQVEWNTRFRSVQLQDHHMLLHQETIRPEDHTLNEGPALSRFTNSLIICYFPNRPSPRTSQGEWRTRNYSIHLQDPHKLQHQQTFTQNITRWMKHQKLFHSLTASSYATSPTEHHPEYHRLNEGRDTLFHSLTGLSYATSPTDHSSRMSQVEWRTRYQSIHLPNHQMLLHQQTIHPRCHRLNEGPDSRPFTYLVIISCFTNIRFTQSVAG